MAGLGISIYPEHSTKERDLAYIHLAGKYGFRRIFTCLLSVGMKTREELTEEFRDLMDASFCDVVLKREEMHPTSFVDTFAIPHAFGAFAKRSTIAVAQLKKPVQWGEFEVKLVMLFAVNENDQRMIKVFFDWISSLVNQMDKMALLSAPLEYEEFMDRIME